MSQFRLRSAGMASLVLCLCLCGCSYMYRVHLKGVVLRASDQSPITTGEVLLLDGTRELGKGQIGSDGTWGLIGEILNADLHIDENGVTWLDEERLMLRIEVAGQRYDVPCPKAVRSKSGYDYYAYVLAAIDNPATERFTHHAMSGRPPYFAPQKQPQTSSGADFWQTRQSLSEE